jgi:putative addiction module component (TIGR02574 family)
MPEDFSTEEVPARDLPTGSAKDLTEAQRDELDARLARRQQDPSSGTDWEQIKKMLRSRA